MGQSQSYDPHLRHQSFREHVTAFEKQHMKKTTVQDFIITNNQQFLEWQSKPWFVAAQEDNLEQLKRHEKEPGFTDCDVQGASVLCIALLADALQVSEYLILNYGSFSPEVLKGKRIDLVNTCYSGKQYDGESALHIAIVKRLPGIVKLLIENGADINARAVGHFFKLTGGGVYFGATPLSFAVCTNQQALILGLMDSGDCDVHCVDEEGNTVLHLCVLYELQEVYDLICDRVEKMATRRISQVSLERTKNKFGLTALMLAAYEGNLKMFQHILARPSNRMIHWSYGNVVEYVYALDQIDTQQSKTAYPELRISDKFDHRTNVCEILVNRSDSTGDIKYATLLQQTPIRDVFSEKWREFARYVFYAWVVVYLVFVIALTFIGRYTPLADPDRYDRDLDTVRLIVEICIVVFVCGQCLVESIDLVRALRSRELTYLSTGMGLFHAIGWTGRLCVLAVAALRFSTNGEMATTIQRALLSASVALAWLYLLMFGRGFRVTGRFTLLLQLMAFNMLQWSVVYLAVLIGYSAAFATMFDQSSSVQFDGMGQSMLTLIALTLGEVDFSEYRLAISPGMALVLYVSYITIVAIIMFNMLIAMMANAHDALSKDAAKRSDMLWASTVLLVERRLPFWLRRRTGELGSEVGLLDRAEQYFLTVVVREHKIPKDSSATLDPNFFRTATHAAKSVHRMSTLARMAAAAKPDNSTPYEVFEPYQKERFRDFRASCTKFSNLRRICDAYDKNMDSHVSRHMCRNIITDIFNLHPGLPKLSLKDVNLLVDALDPDGDYRINIDSFMLLWRLWLRKSGPPKFALIVVDVQNDFLPGGSLAVKDGNRIIPCINNLRRGLHWDFVCYTQDWHPADHCSFKVNKELYPTDTDDDTVLWPVHCVQDTFGSELASSLTKQGDEAMIKKGIHSDVDSYSAFFDNDRINRTELAELLFDANVDEVFVCGLAYDVCVAATASDAISLGYPTYVVKDASGWIDDNTRPTDQRLLRNGVKIVSSEDVADIVKQRQGMNRADRLNDYHQTGLNAARVSSREWRAKVTGPYGELIRAGVSQEEGEEEGSGGQSPMRGRADSLGDRLLRSFEKRRRGPSRHAKPPPSVNSNAK